MAIIREAKAADTISGIPRIVDATRWKSAQRKFGSQALMPLSQVKYALMMIRGDCSRFDRVADHAWPQRLTSLAAASETAHGKSLRTRRRAMAHTDLIMAFGGLSAAGRQGRITRTGRTSRQAMLTPSRVRRIARPFRAGQPAFRGRFEPTRDGPLMSHSSAKMKRPKRARPLTDFREAFSAKRR